MIFLLSLILSFTNTEPLGMCDCDSKIVESYEDLKDFDFIAHIEVKKIYQIDSTEEASKWNYGLQVVVQKQFRGKKSSTIYINGGHSEITQWSTSCDWEINPGSNFIIFGNSHDGIPYSGLCNPVMQNSKNDIRKLEKLLGR